MPFNLPFRAKFKNQANGKAEICIFKRIGDDEESFSMVDMMQVLADVAKVSREVKIRLHCPGGDVIEGLACYRLVNESPLRVTEVVVEGIAASFGFVFLEGFPDAKRVMCKYTRAMCHRITGGTWGNPDDLKTVATQMEALENDLIDIISKRNSETKETIKEKYFDGKDHWFTPVEALAAGLIDEVRDGSITKEPETMVAEELVQFYNELLELPKKESNQKIEKMKFSNEFIAKYGLPAEADSVTIENLINAQMKSKDDKITELTNEVNGFKEKDKTAKKTEFEALLNSDKKKFSADQKANFNSLYEKDPDLAIKTMGLMPDFENLAKIPKDDESNPVIPAQFKGKTFADLQATAEGGKFLETLKEKHFEVYAELYKTQFGKEPQK